MFIQPDNGQISRPEHLRISELMTALHQFLCLTDLPGLKMVMFDGGFLYINESRAPLHFLDSFS